jgi:hypothetical protein
VASALPQVRATLWVRLRAPAWALPQAWSAAGAGAGAAGVAAGDGDAAAGAALAMAQPGDAGCWRATGAGDAAGVAMGPAAAGLLEFTTMASSMARSMGTRCL